MGLIDTLSSGFKVVQRRPWLILPPVLLDLWLWLGPRWSIQPLVDSLLAWWQPANLPTELASTAETYREFLQVTGANFNLWWLVDNNPTWLRTALPSLIDPAHLGAAPGVVVIQPLALLWWTPLLLVLGAALGSLFLATVAAAVAALRANNATDAASEPAAPDASARQQAGIGFWLGRGLRTFMLTALLGLILLALLLAASLLLSLVMTPVLLIAPQAGAVVVSITTLLLSWLAVVAYIMLYFVLAALISDGGGLRQALWRSFNVVYRNFWATLGLVVLVTLILWGFGLIWQRLATASPVGVLVAIVGNAVLVAGLTAARLIFYQQRSAAWLAALSPSAATANGDAER